MECARSLLAAPEPSPHGCVGLCLGEPAADVWRVEEPGRYCDWVAALDRDAAAVAPVAGAWLLPCGGVVWSTGIELEKLCAHLRRGVHALKRGDLTDDAALEARRDLLAAAAWAEAWDPDPEVWHHTVGLRPGEIRKLGVLATCVAHVLVIDTIESRPVKAGALRSLAALAHQALDPVAKQPPRSLADDALRAASVAAETSALVESAQHHFEECRAGHARACLGRALERARAAHLENERSVSLGALQDLEHQFTRVSNVTSRVAPSAGRLVFDSSFLCPAVALPNL